MSLTTLNPVKKKLAEGRVSFGSWIQMGNATVAEILSQVGFDWIALDMEHTEIGIGEFVGAARAMEGRATLPMARVRENDTLAIRQVLDAGAWGVIVPLVNSAEEAERAVRAAKFPPRGIRGTAYFRANSYGLKFSEYMESANQESVVIAMIETKEAVAAIDSILSVEGLDGVFIGPYDLSLSFGIAGRTDDPVMVEARHQVLDACRHARKAAGIHVVQPTAETIRNIVDEGFTFIGLSMDTLFLDRLARQTLKAGLDALG